MKVFKCIFVLVVFLSHATAFSHGEDAAGPHGGEIRMPGAFHTEVTLEGPQQIKVYLLDMHWKNPSVKNSSLEATFTNGSESKANCKIVEQIFLCTFDKKVNLEEKGRLSLKATREKQTGMRVEYKTPLIFKGNK